MSEQPNEFEAIVTPEKMPACPICGKPIREVPDREGQLMVFRAHGLVALAHDGCRPQP